MTAGMPVLVEERGKKDNNQGMDGHRPLHFFKLLLVQPDGRTLELVCLNPKRIQTVSAQTKKTALVVAV